MEKNGQHIHLSRSMDYYSHTFFVFCETPVLGLGLEVGFAFAWDNNNVNDNDNNGNNKNPHLNFLTGTVLGVLIRDKR